MLFFCYAIASSRSYGGTCTVLYVPGMLGGLCFLFLFCYSFLGFFLIIFFWVSACYIVVSESFQLSQQMALINILFVIDCVWLYNRQQYPEAHGGLMSFKHKIKKKLLNRLFSLFLREQSCALYYYIVEENFLEKCNNRRQRPGRRTEDKQSPGHRDSGSRNKIRTK